MNLSADQFDELLHGVRVGDEQAIGQLWNEYFPRLVRLAGKRMAGLPRRVTDEEDLALSALKSFVRAAQAGRFPDLRDADGVWNVLATLTRRKVVDLIRYQNVRPIEGESAMDSGSGARPMERVLGKEPAPEILAAIADEVDSLVRALPEKYRAIALLKLECLTVAEIAARSLVHMSTIERRLRIIRLIWERLRDEGA